MNTKRISIICVLLVAMSVGLMSGCSKKESYKLLYEVSEINQISIVYMTNANQVSNEYETMVVIEDKDKFLEDFKNILFNKIIIGDPTQVNNDTFVILFEYKNGDSEFVDYRAQDRFKNGVCYFGKVKCDREEFENFINFYLPLDF